MRMKVIRKMDNTGKVDKGCRRKFDNWKSQKKKWINNEKDEWWMLKRLYDERMNYEKDEWWKRWMRKRMNDEKDELGKGCMMKRINNEKDEWWKG